MNLPDPEHRLPQAAAEHCLAHIDELVDWTALAPAMEALSNQVGTKLPLSAIKVALLKQWYELADTLAEYTILDRLSFRSFIGFAGDGSTADDEILNELREGAWSDRYDLRPLVDAVEQQLRERGFTVQPGYIAEASIVPCTEGELEGLGIAETPSPRPGELGRMVEAVTAKAHAQGRMPTGPQSIPAVPEDGTVVEGGGQQPIVAEDEQKVRNGRVRAQVEWPWGQSSELTDSLQVGRDYAFSQFARELTPYTHVSRRHAELLVHGDSVWIKDLGSRNGTYVNNDEVPKGQVFLIDSDAIVRFGPLLAVSVKILP